MADQNFLTGSLQESLLTLLAFDDRFGKQVIGLLDLKYFDRPYRDIAEKIIDYRGKYKTAPGIGHIDDLFDLMLETGSEDNRKLVRTMLQSMVVQSKGLNGEYVANKVTDFIRRQTLKDAVVRAGERISQGGDSTDDDVEGILTAATKTRVLSNNAGLFLSNIDDSLSYLDDPAESFRWGIPELDKRGLGPTRKELLLYIAARKRGKTWAMVQIGKMAIIDGKRVCHISLEMGQAKVSARYHQSLFGVAKRPDRNTISLIELDEFGAIRELRQGHMLPKFSYTDPDIRSKLAAKLKQGGSRFRNLVVKSFPTGALTLQRLNNYLDYLEDVEGFTPDILIVDYPDLFQLDPKNIRTSTGQVYVGLRGIAGERNIAVVAPTQGNRNATTAKEVSESDVSEDISKVATADTVISYSQTKAEKALKLARLTVTNARNDEDGFSVLISQNYAQGAYCLSSAMVSSHYHLALKRATGDMSDGDDED